MFYYYHMNILSKDLGNWIKSAREYANLTQTNIGDLIGRTKANVSSMETGKHDPSYLQLLKIAQATKYPVPFPGIERPVITASLETETEGYIRLDYLDIQSSAGPGKVADAYPPLIQSLNVLEDWALQSFGKNAVEKIKIINNCGDSMCPTIQDGDILFVDVSRIAFEAEGIYVLDWNGRLLTKRLVAQQDGRLAIISDNSSYQPEYINEKNIDSLVICGQVRGWWSFKRF